jgi:chondroitin AC lyase
MDTPASAHPVFEGEPMKHLCLLGTNLCYYIMLLSSLLMVRVTQGEAGAGAQQTTIAGTLNDIAEIQSRYAASVLPTSSEQMNYLRNLSAQYANSLQPDGEWPDIQYQNDDRATWKAAEHLERTLVMAKCSRLAREQGKPDSVLNEKAIRALQAWTDRDYQNPNWWWNQIGVPELLGEIATLMQPKLSPAELQKIVEIMKRAEWRKDPWTGANLTWGVEIQIVRGCLESDLATVAEGFARMYEEIKIVSPTQEGIEQDDSFHQHGPQLYSGGYGLFYANDVGRFIAFGWGTRFQIPTERMAIFSSYLLDGEQWMIRGDVFDYNAVGRVITRQGFVALPKNWTVGPVSPAGPAYSLGNMIAMLAAEPIPRRQEFAAFAARIEGKLDAPEFIGNKQFWCSDFMVHRRKTFYTSVKMLSNRTLGGELVNDEGRKSQHLSDGMNLLYMTGDEYKDIFPVWDWTKLPGTTAIQGTLETGESNPIGVRGETAFDGGVSDGSYGMAAMDLDRGNLSAKKAWFFFDDSYLCLGADITLSGDKEHRVATDVNQSLLDGPVFISRSKKSVVDGVYQYTQGKGMWVFHDNVGYVFPPASDVRLSVEPQSGRWSDIGSGSSQQVSLGVFNLWIDHGISPKGATYQYVVVPGATVEETIAHAKRPNILVLANNSRIQAAWSDRLQAAMMAFRQAGSLATPVGLVVVDHSCLLLVRSILGGWSISAANPENLPLVLHVTIENREVTMNLPGGNLAGSSVTSTIRADTATEIHLMRPVTWSAR